MFFSIFTPVQLVVVCFYCPRGALIQRLFGDSKREIDDDIAVEFFSTLCSIERDIVAAAAEAAAKIEYAGHTTAVPFFTKFEGPEGELCVCDTHNTSSIISRHTQVSRNTFSV